MNIILSYCYIIRDVTNCFIEIVFVYNVALLITAIIIYSVYGYMISRLTGLIRYPVGFT